LAILALGAVGAAVLYRRPRQRSSSS